MLRIHSFMTMIQLPFRFLSCSGSGRETDVTPYYYTGTTSKSKPPFSQRSKYTKFFVYIIDNGRHLCYNTVKSGSMPTSRKDVRVGTWTDLGRKEGVANGNCNNRT